MMAIQLNVAAPEASRDQDRKFDPALRELCLVSEVVRRDFGMSVCGYYADGRCKST